MKKQSYIPLIASICIVVGIAFGYLFINKPQSLSFKKQDKISYVLDLIESEYVDKTDRDSLSDEAITSLLKELDPHSVYMTAEQVKKENESLRGNFDGIGVQFRIVEDSITVVRTIKGGPSEKAGIIAGDRIVKVDGKNLTKNVTNDTVLHYLKGPRNSKVTLSIYRRGVKNLLSFTVIRDKIETKAVDYFGMLNDSVGYIKLNEFSATSHKEVSNALLFLVNSGMKELVFDLRGNGGGYLDQATKIADEFIKKSDLITYTEGRYRGRQDYFATNGGLFENGKIIVLIDETSASASEIVSGCIQDNDRGIILGRRTFGKGLVQEQKDLPDGSAIRLTIARYYTPSGRCIQRPYINGDPEQYYQDFLDRYANMEENADTLKHDDKLKYKTKKGRIVYGGGGIEPDIPLPYSMFKRSEYYSKLVRQGIIFRYCFDYIDKHREEFSQYKEGKQFLNQYSVDANQFSNLINYAEKNGIKRQNISQQETSEIKTLMKAYMAQEIFGDEYFYKIYTSLDKELQKSLEYL
ncbi:MAG: S41 family peptidase [Bacteroidales bacterium]|nr:S41 family peptidase [Bacteroidales bacterium]